MTKILFITANRLGDAVLSSGILNHLLQTHPDAELTIACGSLPASLFEGIPQLSKLHILKKQKHHKHWIDLWRDVIGTRWDIVVDLRNSAVSRLIFARQRFIYGPHIARDLHKAEQNAAVLGLEPVPPLHLWPSEAQEQKSKALIPDGAPVIAIGPTANWIGKIWPAERFIALIASFPAHYRVAVFAAPGEEDQALPVLNSIAEGRRIDMIAKADPGTAAAALSRCHAFIGHDSGLMHCAAAAGIPTFGLFGPTRDDLYRPWGDQAYVIRTPESYHDLTGQPDFDVKTTGSLMSGLRVETVQAKIGESGFID